MSSKISFIEAKSPGNHVFSKFPLPRLGSILLSTLLKQKGYYVRTFIEDIADPDWFFIENSNIVCISTITSTALRAYHLAQKFRENGRIVILGGIHPTFMPEEAIEYADYVIRGEGEQSFIQLIEHIHTGYPPLSAILGLTYKNKDGKIIHNAPSSLIENLDSLPEPDFSLIHNWKSSNLYPIATSRGCPFSCKFCSVIEMFGRRYRYKSIESTIKEIKNVLNPSHRTRIFFVDDNFAANKERTKNILKAILSEKLNLSWNAQTRVDVIEDDELLRLMADSGCDTLHIGFESINPHTLDEFNKKQTIDDNIRCIKKLKEYSLRIHGMFVLGADTDDVDTIKKTFEFAYKLGIETVQFLMLTPLPGTIFYQEMENNSRIIHHDWSKYDAHHVTFIPKMMRPEILHLETLKAMSKFYSWKYIIRHLLKLDFFYAGMGLYAKNAVKDALREAQNYFKDFRILSEGLSN